MKHPYLAPILCVAALGALSTPAGAASVFNSYDFTVTGMEGPIPDHSGSFSFTYDDVTFAAALVSIDFTLGGTTYSTANAGITNAGIPSELGFILGGTLSGVFLVNSGAEDFFITFNVPDEPDLFVYSQVGFDTGWGANVTLTATNGVPEPSTWAMMIAGFGLVGGVMRRRPRVQFATARVPRPGTD